MRLVCLLLLASFSLPLRAKVCNATKMYTNDTIDIFLLNHGIRVKMNDSVLLVRSTRDLKTFIQNHKGRISLAFFKTSSDAPLDSVRVILEILRTQKIRPAVLNDQ